jgi:hypothetical protein
VIRAREPIVEPPQPAPEPLPAVEEPEPEPQPSLIDDADPIDMDDLDTPAYLRQGRLPV